MKIVEYRKIQKFGDSLAVTIPKSFAEKLGLKRGQHVKIVEEDGRLIIEPAK